MPGPLEGVRILDATTMLSGPWATMILADQGADVIKIEACGKGDHVRSLGNARAGMSAMFLNINRNKRSLAIDLKTQAGVEAIKELAAGADVSCRISGQAWLTGLASRTRSTGDQSEFDLCVDRRIRRKGAMVRQAGL